MTISSCFYFGVMHEIFFSEPVFHGAGEIYLAFFNLDSMSRKMTVQISDLGKVLGRNLLEKNPCSYTEVWSGKNFGPVKEEISAVVHSHGSMVFEIIC
jgi:hypothetical protein